MKDSKLSRRVWNAVMGVSPLAAAAIGNAGGSAVPEYARAMPHRALRQSSYDRSGGNHDSWPIAPGAEKEIFRANGPGAVTHVWFTIAAPSPDHLKELVLRAWWDDAETPSIEAPVGDFFGLNLGMYRVYQSAFLNCSPKKGLNCYLAMPYRKSARMTVTNEGARAVDAFYSNIDYQTMSSLPEDALYFHAQYRQEIPTKAIAYPNEKAELNEDGRGNYVFVDTTGQGHLLGVTMGVLQNAPRWMGEGDDMTYIDSDRPTITGTGTEDYFCGGWNFNGPDNAMPFAHLYTGAHIIESAELTGGRYDLYRWHADNPITFEKRLKHTIEHGHANDRGDSVCSVAYWYQTPIAKLAPLPPLQERMLVASYR